MKKSLKHIKNHIFYNHIFHLILGLFFGIGLIIYMIGSNAQETGTFFPFNTFIAGHNNTTSIHFGYGGNNLTGILAWSGRISLATPENIYLTGSNSYVSCSKQLEGLYYNGIRGSTIWPLDQISLQKLKNIDSSYSDLTLVGGIYSNCVGTGIQSNFVIGQVDHGKAGLLYTMFFGLRYDIHNNAMSTTQDLYGGTVIFQNNSFQGKVFDLYGGGIGDLSNQTIPGEISIGGFSGAVFFPGISSVLNAEPRKLYQSNSFTVVGLTGTTLVRVSSGILFINGSGVGTTGMITNNVPLKVEMFASDNFDTTVTSFINIGSLTGNFSITTKPKQPDRCMLTKEEKNSILEVFSGLLLQYENATKLTVLMNTMKSMINDMQDFNYDCNLEYLESLVADYLESLTEIDEATHTAPNCKKYPVIYNEDKKGYTSPIFKVRQYFATRESLIRFIDSKNPGDCHISIYNNDYDEYSDIDENMYVAPNGKVYEIVESDGLYSSSTMSNKKEFSSRESLISFIEKNNPTIEIRDHKVDTSMEPIIYAATNSKEYKIYKTDMGFMSYKLVKIQYFFSQEEIIAYIERNNKR